MFATDRDLAALDPAAFRDAAWIAQVVTRGTGSISGVLLNATAIEVPFTDTAIEAGYVAVLGAGAFEAVQVLGPNDLEVTRMRDSFESLTWPGVNVPASPFAVVTFRPQIETVHRRILQLLGMHASPFESSVTLPDSRIVNPWDFVRLEALGALHLVYAAAGAIEPEDSPANQRAAMYRRRFAEERSRVVAHVDLDGDGRVDVLRPLNAARLVRG